ncbi:Lanthionine synthetase C-like protein [Chitinophaga jiangningensis]|uniref:Lanthionine synthetase C-like protein n=1 Tax=Chitinophaga jiangningensis TaxID=1419482 RepID=A0A1M6YF96_9BACT|nr:lanthionine synthetase LanC family protein [Chitinophaga jiangningensis]SHL16976.1 Lanthionine synthetase C-like protein [Chitinophaga jiangningensis]
MKTATFINNKLEQLDRDLTASANEQSRLALLTGNSGLALFYYHMYHHFGDEQYRNRAAAILEEAMEEINKGIRSYTYCDGLAGYAYLLNYLQQKDFIDNSITDFLIQCDEILYSVFGRMQLKSNTDLLHGSLGLAAYFLDRYQSGAVALSSIREIGEAIRLSLDKVVHDRQAPQEEVYVNCGMAHGIVSMILFLVKYHPLADNQDAVSASLKAGVDCLLQFKSTDPASISLYPSIVKVNAVGIDTTYNIPLGWCYGDIIVSIGLYRAGSLLQDNDLLREAECLALAAAKRNTPRTALVHDACLCHGGAGLAHMYKKWYRFTGNEIFNASYHLWMDKTLELSNHPDGIGGFKKYNGGPFVQMAGILDGAAGMGLVLMDYLQGDQEDNDWDRVLFLA